MRIVVTGATGNLGTSLLTALADEAAVESIVGVARRVPEISHPKVVWRSADVVADDLVGLFQGADAVVHLVWIVQPNHDEAALQRVNVGGAERVLAAIEAAGVPTLVCASAFGAYSPGPGGTRASETWPTHGIPGSWYSRQKAYVERLLDAFELANPQVRVVRFRSALILKREAAAQAHRLYGGPLLPRRLARPGFLPALIDVAGLRVQAVHSSDVADAYRRALLSDVRGAFNLAAEPVLDARSLASLLETKLTRAVPAGLVRSFLTASWRLRLQPTSPDWLDLLVQSPLLDTRCAREVLDWSPARSAVEALDEFVRGIADGAGGATPPLLPLAAARPSFRP